MPTDKSPFISWAGAITAMTLNEKIGLAVGVLTIIYTTLKIVGWFLDRKGDRD